MTLNEYIWSYMIPISSYIMECTLSLVIMKVMTIEIADMMLSGYNSNQCDLNCTYEIGGMH